MSEPEKSASWEREVLEKLALAALKEQRVARHWNIFFRILGFSFLFLIFFSVMGWIGNNAIEITGKHTALVELNGTIASGEVSANQIISGLQAAFKDKNTKGVILRINSPGGSPVQAGQIYDEIKRLRVKYPNIPLYVVVDDLCASGGYYVAAAADRIYVDKASLIGSIGVLMDGFGFTGTMDKLGVERRLLTAGTNKGFLDPFSPVNPQQENYAKVMLEEIHQQFIKAVRDGRGARLKETPDMFSGLIWSGEKAVSLGLADGFGSTEYVARDVIHAENVVDFTPQEGFADRFAKRFGVALGKNINPLAAMGMELH
ncbi:S49 family peptidase [Sulfuriferula sp. AH1]|uniref:S49 family peptidase n=1 Tax=Sulfuriferula sp. AH1 TaxID=1985873 RepID=UPI000B3B2939|nr:S49 family peptidase [Sulfuriferula sp. AH1]ARU31348.1 S49 family peptidase [Sulfuriferula sp. AH1]